MSRGLKRFFVVCAVAVGIGVILAIAGLMTGGLSSMDKLSQKYTWIHGNPGEMVYTEIKDVDNFNSMKIKGDIDVHITSVAEKRNSVKLGHREKLEAPKVYVKNGVLTVDAGSGNNFVGINFADVSETPAIEINCSKDRAMELMELDLESGDIVIDGISAEEIGIYSEYGDTIMKNCTFDEGIIESESGDMNFTGITSKGLKIENEYGDCRLSGNIKGVSDISMEEGDLVLNTMLSEREYTVSAKSDTGSLAIGDLYYSDDYECSYTGGTGSNYLDISSEYGDVKVNFDCNSTGKGGVNSNQSNRTPNYWNHHGHDSNGLHHQE